MILSPGAVVIVGASSGVSVVGAPPQWADGSDATYGEFVVDVANYGTLLSASLEAAPVAVTSASLFVRTEHSATETGSLVSASVVSAGGVAYAAGELVGGNYYLDVPQGTISETTVPLEPAAGASLADIFNGSCDLRFSWASSSAGYVIRILEAHVIVEVDAAVTYRRIFPRDDALAGGPGRNYPRPRAVQSSNRTSGYL